MYSPTLILLLAIILAVLIASYILGQLLHRRHRRRARSYAGAKRSPRRSGLLKVQDHGARIARTHGRERSPEWHRVAKEHLLREPSCAACGYKGKKLQVHHIKPFHLHPQLELDPQNLITLCAARGREHHLLLGHLDEWASYNEHIRVDVKRFYRKTAAQIRADLIWQKKLLQRP
ncbi:MAG TPA: HNH endonuclease signature motif containing protein [Ktedonobacteraceae bacterium]|nr:HNH endonuclease signature motif containing protein [Ktedonobacteraceae bacterium]